MSARKSESTTIELIGHYEMQIGFTPPTPEAKARCGQQVETLANWPLHRWESEHHEAAHERAIPADHSKGSR